MKLYILPKVYKIHALFGLPAMTRTERRIIQQLLSSINIEEDIDVFEYGSGYSTIFFSEFLKGRRIPFHYFSVENDRGWHEKVKRISLKKKLENNITLFLSEFTRGGDWPSSQGSLREAENEYINKARDLNQKFDFILIDGRFRRRCLEVALKCLKPNGVALLHDAEREFYHSPFKLYDYSRIFESGKYYPFERRKHRFWIGAQEGSKIDDVLKRTREIN